MVLIFFNLMPLDLSDLDKPVSGLGYSIYKLGRLLGQSRCSSHWCTPSYTDKILLQPSLAVRFAMATSK